MRGEFCVNVSRFSAPLVGSYGESCVAEKTKRGRDKESKRQKVKEKKSPRDKKTKRQRDKKTKRLRVKKTKRRREEETKGREDENRVTSYSPPIHLLFVSSSPPLHRLFTAQFVQILFNSCPKTFARFVSKTVLHQGTPLRERSVKVTLVAKWEWEAQ